MSSAAILAEFSRLEMAEQIQLVEDLWDRIAAQPEPPPMTEAQKQELQRRKALITSWPPQGTSWQDLKARLLVDDV